MLTFEQLRERLHYNPDTGVFTYVKRSGKKRPGEIAGVRGSGGYNIIGVQWKRYRAARLAWLWMTGEWPDRHVDHKDLDKGNDAWSNLRLATRSQNHANCRVRKNNIVGVKGVGITGSGKFAAHITINRRKRHLGSFDTPEEAHCAYMHMALLHYGEFARAA